jgi:hypothetical protein
MRYKQIHSRTYILVKLTKFSYDIPFVRPKFEPAAYGGSIRSGIYISGIYKRAYNPEPIDWYNEYFEHFNPLYEFLPHHYFCYFSVKGIMNEV